MWRRHTAIMALTILPKIICSRCRIELPISLVPGQIVLSKADRLFIGDDFKAVDCEL